MPEGRQYMTHIKGTRAVNGDVILDVYATGIHKDGVLDLGAPVRTKVLSIEEAYDRAAMLVVMASRVETKAEGDEMIEVAKELMARAAEAKQQRLDQNRDPAGKTLGQ